MIYWGIFQGPLLELFLLGDTGYTIFAFWEIQIGVRFVEHLFTERLGLSLNPISFCGVSELLAACILENFIDLQPESEKTVRILMRAVYLLHQ